MGNDTRYAKLDSACVWEMDEAIIWETAINDIPGLLHFCDSLLETGKDDQ